MERTCAIFKPDGVKKKVVGQVIDRIERAGFRIVAMKLLRLTPDVARSFYDVHRARTFFPELIEFMTEGPCVVAVLEKENAVEDYRSLMGATDPAAASEGSIRKDFAENVSRNIVHGSDSAANAAREIAFFFSDSELIATA